MPDLLFVIDTNKESIAVAEARKLKIPVIAIVDTNCDPDEVDFPIPGNDDAGRAISLYCDLISRAAIDGIERAQGGAGIDIGESEKPPVEEALEPAPAADDASAKDAKKANGKSAEPKKAKADKAEDKKADDKKADDKAADDKAADDKAADDKAAAAKKKADDDKKSADKPEKDAKAEKAPKAKAGGFERLKKPDGEADDLKALTGVGPVLEKSLNEYGIFHYRQIGGLKKAEIAEIDEALGLKGRIERDDWVKQAKELAKK